jgi:acetyltransferase-like isoleucine patch superfamily enzyme
MTKALSVAKETLWKERGDLSSYPWAFLVNGILGSPFFPNRVRTQLLRLCGLDIDRRVIVRPGTTFRSKKVTVGPRSTIGYNVLFDIRSQITIGSNVGIGSGTVFLDTDHDMSDPTVRAGRTHAKPILIGNGARVSTGTMVLPGVTIGDGAVVGAGSLVTKDCEPHSLYVGRPARKVRDLPR